MDSAAGVGPAPPELPHSPPAWGQECQARAEKTLLSSVPCLNIHPCLLATGAAQKLKGEILSLSPFSFLCVLRDGRVGRQGLGTRGALQSPPPALPRAVLSVCALGRKGPVLQRSWFCTHLQFGYLNKTYPERTEASRDAFFVPTIKNVGGHWDYPISELSQLMFSTWHMHVLQ